MAANSGPRIGAVIISELHYTPDSGEEYAEIHITSTT